MLPICTLISYCNFIVAKAFDKFLSNALFLIAGDHKIKKKNAIRYKRRRQSARFRRFTGSIAGRVDVTHSGDDVGHVYDRPGEEEAVGGRQLFYQCLEVVDRLHQVLQGFNRRKTADFTRRPKTVVFSMVNKNSTDALAFSSCTR